MSLVVVGSVAYDTIETPFGKRERILGGAGTYVSLSACNFCKPKLISVVGYDFKNEDLQLISDHGIDISGVEVNKNEKTFFWSGRYHNNMNSRDSLATELNSLGTFNPKVPETYQGARVLMLGNLSPQVQMKVIKGFYKRPEMIIMDTMNFWMNATPVELAETIKLIDVLTINDEEARQLSGEYSLLNAAEKILTMGPKFLIIKKGEHGAMLFNSKLEIFYAPAFPLKEVFDPTGAGDTFAGGFAGYLAKQEHFSFENMKKAIVAGSVIASYSVENFGVENLLELNMEIIQQRAKDFINLTKVDFDGVL